MAKKVTQETMVSPIEKRKSIYFPIGNKKYRLAFTILQWEMQLRLTEEHPGTVGALTSMIYSAMCIANRQDRNSQGAEKLDIEFAEVETEVDIQVASNSQLIADIIAFRNEVHFYKKALEIAQQNKDQDEDPFTPQAMLNKP